jgi:AcrR family transcriptional regulator
MARPRSATFEQQRDAMLAAAAQLFAERGYAATSIADLAAQFGVSKGLLYHYYRDKEHLLFDIADRYVDRLVQLTEEVEATAEVEVTATAAPEAALRQLIERFMVAYEHAGAFHRVLVQDVKYLSAVHRARVRTKQRQVIDAFARAIAAAAPELAGDRLLKPVTMTLFGMMNWTFTWLRADGPVAHAEFAPIVADLFLGGVRRLHTAGGVGSRARSSANRSTKIAELTR